MLDITKIPLDDPDVWAMIQNGLVKGCFQIESQLGRQWCKKIKPRSIEELSDVISLIRPGCLKFIYDGKSMTQHYADRKFGLEDNTPLDDSIADILADTYSVITYQEQIIKIAQKIAGFDGNQADTLRKSVGKKDATLMQKCRKEFIEGCKNVGIVDENKAKTIFNNIEKSSRYSFNRCLSPDTLVELENGEFVTLEEVEIGQKIKAPNDNNSCDNYVLVLDKFDNGEKELFEFELDSGKTIKCTIDHKLLCEDGILRPVWEILQENYKVLCEND